MATLRSAEQDQLQKLLLGQLPTAEIERMATEFADDARLAELAESLVGKDDALLSLLQNHEAAVVDPEGERLVERLLQRLKPAIPVKPGDETFAVNRADATTEPSSINVAAMLPVLPERLEYYRPIKVLGQGGMGTVYLAEDTRLGREVAIKTLRPELAINAQAKERFLREARSAAKLEHDHIIPIYSVGEADGTPFLAMPFLKGEPLDALIRRAQGQLPVATVVRLAREVASGLAAAHARGLIHRDIKPANIWLEAPTGRVKILDFGLAKAADAGNEVDSETHLTASGAIVGTPAYMAPEQASGNPVDGRADLFSLGCVLYELLTGRRAFSGANTMSILMSLATHTPPAPDTLSSECPAALSQLVMQLLAKDPAKRPASAEAVIQALSELDSSFATATQNSHVFKTSGVSRTEILQLSDSSLEQPPTRILSVTKPTHPKRRLAFALFGTLLLLLLAAVVYRIQTDKGTLIVEIVDDAVEAKLKTNGLEVRDSTSGRSFSIQAEGSLREPTGDFKVVDGQGLKLVVLDADGLELKTNEFKLVRDGEVRVSVRAETNGVASTSSPQALATNPDRRAAEYVLSVGGGITIKENGQERQLWDASAKLPQATFELTTAFLERNPKVNDAGLANFKDCKNLTSVSLMETTVSDFGLAHFKDSKKLSTLILNGTQVSDAGLAFFADCKKLAILTLSATRVTDGGMVHFQDCKNLTVLGLNGTQVSDAGLVPFKNCQNLVTLILDHTRVTDAGLVHFKNCKQLQQLSLDSQPVTDAGLSIFADCKDLTMLALSNTKVTDTGLAQFRDCKNLIHLQFIETGIGDAGLAHFKDCNKLGVLYLTNTKVTDVGLAHIHDCKDLVAVQLSGTQVTDNGLEPFANCPKLHTMNVKNTKVSEAGVKKLSAALPGCKIEWDGGVIEPNSSNGWRGWSAEAPLPAFAPFNVEHAKLHQGAWAKYLGVPVEYTNTIGMTFCLIPPGEFTMGSTAEEIAAALKDTYGDEHWQKCIKSEAPRHKVILTRPTYLGVNEVTQADYEKVMGVNPSHFAPMGAGKEAVAGLETAEHPVEMVSWNDAAEFCAKLSKQEKLKPFYFRAGEAITPLDGTGYRLPSEAEWEFACRAGTATKYWYGDQDEDLVRAGWFVGNSGGRTQAAGELKANPFGLSDTHGNVWEWVQDGWDATFYGQFQDKPAINPNSSFSARSQSVVRGGGWSYTASPCRSSDRYAFAPTHRGHYIGFRASLPVDAVRQTLKVTGPAMPKPVAIDSDRRAAEWVLSVGGSATVRINGELRQFADSKDAPAKLPTTPFELVRAELNNRPISDADLAHLDGVPKLEWLDLSGTKITDVALKRLQKHPGLYHLEVSNTSITGAGLANLQGCNELTQLVVASSRIGDAGLAHLQKLPKLQHLQMYYSDVTDEGLAQLKAIPNLTSVNANSTRITGSGLVHLKGLPIDNIQLSNTPVTDAELKHLLELPKLHGLELNFSQITDTGLETLQKCKQLRVLQLRQSKVTADGVKKLATALPDCEIHWDGGTSKPKASTDR